MSELERINDALRREAPAAFAALSELGRQAVYPPDIPFQAAQAKACRFNATLGQITDGRGRILALRALESGLAALGEAERNRALLYSPMEGLPELRSAWQRWQRPADRDAAELPASSVPLVTVGLTHGLSLVADLFAGPGRPILVPAPFWGNYRQIFALRTGAELRPVNAYRDGRFVPTALASAAAELVAGEPAVVVLNLPSNPGGYMPSAEQRRLLVDSLVEAASARPLVVVCDDAYARLVYDPAVPRESLFWELAGRDPNLIPIKVDGATKELVLFGGRVGFLTFPWLATSAAVEALESKVKCLLRATVGSPVATSQVLALLALEDGEVGRQVEAVRETLGRRLRVLQASLAACDPTLLRPLPANAGAFALVELADGIDAERLRRHLIDEEDLGVVALPPRYVRIAFCSVDESDLPEVVRRLERGVSALAAR